MTTKPTLAERLHAALCRPNLDTELRALLEEAGRSVPGPPPRKSAIEVCQRMADAGMRRIHDGQVVVAIVVDGADKALLSNLEPMDQIPEMLRAIAEEYENAQAPTDRPVMDHRPVMEPDGG